MKKIFLFLLKKYSRTESGRVEILTTLDEQVKKEYYEQTYFGNVYNHYFEFLLSNGFFKDLVNKNDKTSLKILKRGIDNTFDRCLEEVKRKRKK